MTRCPPRPPPARQPAWFSEADQGRRSGAAQDSDASDSEDERRHRRYRHSSDSDSEDDERRRKEEDKPRTPIDFETFQTIVIGRNSLEKIVHDAFFEVPLAPFLCQNVPQISPKYAQNTAKSP